MPDHSFKPTPLRGAAQFKRQVPRTLKTNEWHHRENL